MITAKEAKELAKKRKPEIATKEEANYQRRYPGWMQAVYADIEVAASLGENHTNIELRDLCYASAPRFQKQATQILEALGFKVESRSYFNGDFLRVSWEG